MRKCAKECYVKKECCANEECRLYMDYGEDLNCTLIAVGKHGPMTLEEIGKRHHVSTVRAKQIVDLALVKLKKTLDKENTI
jgi:DNA-directed RNA polymerase sigma subunit (sigma70/sigma32)